MIRKATLQDLDAIWNIIEAASKKLASDHDAHHWANYYTPEIIRGKLESMPSFVLEDEEGKVKGVYALSSTLPGYLDGLLKYETKPNSVYLNMLGVDPNLQGKGIGKKLVLDSENKARELGYEYMIFDTNSKVSYIVDFYKRLGFEVVGELIDEGDKYLFFEKKL